MPTLALSGAGAVMLLAPAVIILGGLAVIVRFAWWDQRWWRAFQTRAAHAEATVVGARVLTHGSVQDRNRSRAYQPEVTFALPDGSTQKARTRWAQRHQPTQGDVIGIRYDPQDPAKVVHAEGLGSEPPPRGAAIGIGVAAIVFGWIVLSVIRAIL